MSPYLSISQALDGTPTTSLRQVSAFVQQPFSAAYTASAPDGPCAILVQQVLSPPSMMEVFDPGVLTAESPQDGKQALSPVPGVPAVWSFQYPNGTTYGLQETITVSATGGATVGPFSLSEPVPNTFHFAAPIVVTAGQPLTLTWDPPEPLKFISFSGGGSSVMCAASGPGQLVIPGSMTSILAQNGPEPLIGGFRATSTQSVLDPVSGYMIHVVAMSTFQIHATLGP